MRIDEYVAKRKYALKPSTLQRHVEALRTFERITGCHDREPTLEDVEFFLDSFERAGLKHTTVSVVICSALKQYFKLFHPQLVPELERIFEMRKPKVSISDFRSVHLTKDDIREIISRLKLPHNLIIAMMYSFCRRLGEVLALEKKDVTKTTITFNIYKKKGLMRVVMPMDLLPEKWRDTLFIWMDMVRGSKVFPITKKAVEIAFKKVVREIGKENAKVHDVRHARIRHLLDDGVDPWIIKDKLSFHEHMSMIWDIYGKLKPDYKVEVPKADI